MKIKRGLIVGTSLLMMMLHTSVNAYIEQPLAESKDCYSKSIIANISEENEVIELLNHDIVVNSDTYNIQKIIKNQNEDVKKTVSKQKKNILNTSNQEYIKKYFGEKYSYEDTEYKGEIPITNIHINRIDNGQYQELREKIIEFNNYSKNDLDAIDKEIKIDNTTYYLIKVDWQVEKTELIDNQEVPISYKGIMIYQTVVTINNPYEYEVTVTYSGEVSNKEKEYTYTAIYTKQEEIVENKQDNNIVPIIAISGLGIGLATIIFLLSTKNVVIYNKTSSGYKVLGRYKVSKEGKKEIDISKYNHKITSNMYLLKLKDNLYEKNKGKTIFIKIENISKPVTITNKIIEFII